MKEKIYYKSSNIAKYQEPSYTRKPKKYDNSNYEKIHYKSSKYEDNEYFEQDHYTYRSNNYKSYDNPVISSNNKTYEKKKVYPAYGQYRKEYPVYYFKTSL